MVAIVFPNQYLCFSSKFPWTNVPQPMKVIWAYCQDAMKLQWVMMQVIMRNNITSDPYTGKLITTTFRHELWVDEENSWPASVNTFFQCHNVHGLAFHQNVLPIMRLLLYIPCGTCESTRIPILIKLFIPFIHIPNEKQNGLSHTVDDLLPKFWVNISSTETVAYIATNSLEQVCQTHGHLRCFMRSDSDLELYTMCGPKCPNFKNILNFKCMSNSYLWTVVYISIK
jgi:hypothetical protein